MPVQVVKQTLSTKLKQGRHMKWLQAAAAGTIAVHLATHWPSAHLAHALMRTDASLPRTCNSS
jgi:hypothetical protein